MVRLSRSSCVGSSPMSCGAQLLQTGTHAARVGRQVERAERADLAVAAEPRVGLDAHHGAVEDLHRLAAGPLVAAFVQREVHLKDRDSRDLHAASRAERDAGPGWGERRRGTKSSGAYRLADLQTMHRGRTLPARGRCTPSPPAASPATDRDPEMRRHLDSPPPPSAHVSLQSRGGRGPRLLRRGHRGRRHPGRRCGSRRLGSGDRLVMRTIREILEDHGMGVADLVRVDVHLLDPRRDPRDGPGLRPPPGPACHAGPHHHPVGPALRRQPGRDHLHRAATLTTRSADADTGQVHLLVIRSSGVQDRAHGALERGARKEEDS